MLLLYYGLASNVNFQNNAEKRITSIFSSMVQPGLSACKYAPFFSESLLPIADMVGMVLVDMMILCGMPVQWNANMQNTDAKLP